MSTGDQADFVARLHGQLPANWFPNPSPVLDTILNGNAANLSSEFALAQFAKAQMRLATQTNGFIDLTANDFFGYRFVRPTAQTDSAWALAVNKEVLRPRNTRAAYTQVLTDLTGVAPIIVEFTNGQDCGSYNGPYIGYSIAGSYGTVIAHAQFFLTAFRPASTGIPNVPGYNIALSAMGSTIGGYNLVGEWGSLSQIIGGVTDAQIYAAVESVEACGVIAWTQILNAVSAPPAGAAPFAEYDWPNPAGPLRVIDLRTHIQQGGQLYYKDFTGPLNFEFDKPNPYGAAYPISLRSITGASIISNPIAITLPLPFVWDKPNPAGPVGTISLKTWTMDGGQKFYQDNVGPLNFSFDKPNPIGPLFPISLRTNLNAPIYGGAILMEDGVSFILMETGSKILKDG